MDHTDEEVLHSERIRAQAERYIEECHAYTAPYEREKIKRDWQGKVRKTESLLNDFRKRAGDIAGKEILEIGFGSGLQAVVFARAGAHVHGLEVNPVLLDIALENINAYGLSADLEMYDGVHIPYPDNSFDYIYSLSVFEHVSDLPGLLQEVARVLKPDGRVYISFPNRFALKETHTGVWLASYMPRPLATWVLKVVTQSDAMRELNLHFLSFFSFKRLADKTGLAVRFEVEGGSSLRRGIKKVLAIFGVHYSALLATVMLVLEKKSKDTA